MWCILLIVTIIGLFYLYMRNTYNYWKKRGVDTPPYHYVVGNLLEQLTLTKNVALIMQDQYKAFEGYNYFGVYNAMQPAIVVRNPEIVGDMLIKDFASFADNDFDIDEKTDPIFGKNPFMLKGQKWKHVRAQSTPTFTSGKIKAMMPLIKETSAKLLTYMKDNENIPMELDQLNKRINADNVASCAFGLDGQSFTQEKAPFVEIANQPTTPTLWNTITGLLLFVFPALSRFLNLSFFHKHTVEYLRGIIEDTMNYREKHNVQRNDLLDDMKRLKEKINDSEKFNFMDILGHAGGFILDGIVTSSAIASHALYDIASNPEVQDKLRKEIKDVLQKLQDNNEELSYENIQEMEYLDCVFKESLRQHTPLMFQTKRVTKPYTLRPMREDGSGPELHLEVGVAVSIPTYALHMDEKYFPEPEKYDPERWRKENKDKIVKNTYLPFSDGPRACLGLRFALLQIKITVITILDNYKLKVSGKTKEPLKIDPANFINSPVGGHWLEFSKL